MSDLTAFPTALIRNLRLSLTACAGTMLLAACSAEQPAAPDLPQFPGWVEKLPGKINFSADAQSTLHFACSREINRVASKGRKQRGDLYQIPENMGEKARVYFGQLDKEKGWKKIETSLRERQEYWIYHYNTGGNSHLVIAGSKSGYANSDGKLLINAVTVAAD